MNKILIEWKKIALGALAGILVGAIVGYVVFVGSTPMWEGSSTVYIGVQPAVGEVPAISEQIHLVTQPPTFIVEMVRSRKFIIEATSAAGRPDLAEMLLNSGVRVKIIRNSPIIIISLRAASKDDARFAVDAIANAIVSSLRAMNEPQLNYAKQFLDQSQSVLDQDKQNYDAISAQINKVKINKDSRDENYLHFILLQNQSVVLRNQLLSRMVSVKLDYFSALSKLPKVVSDASVSEQAISPDLSLLLLIGMVLGLLIGSGISLILLVGKDVFKSRGDNLRN